MIKVNELQNILNMSSYEAEEWHSYMEELFPKYGITTTKREAMFLAQTGHESRNYTALEENLNYSASALERVFGKYFQTRAMARKYARRPEAIANVVYANRMGNGPTSSGDGWRHRGFGIIQLTGKNNQSAFAESIGLSLNDAIEYLKTKKGALEGALWFWEENNINHYADRQDVRGATRRINGGTHGLTDRRRRYNEAITILEGKINTGRRILKLGMEGPDVKAVQEVLRITTDGDFGPNTKYAVRMFQAEKGLTADGIVGPNTFRALGIA